MAADDGAAAREELWFEWAKATLGGDEYQCRRAAQAAAVMQGAGAGFEAAAAAARAAFSEMGAPVSRPTAVQVAASNAAHFRAHVAQAPVRPIPAPSRGLSSWVSGATSEDLFYGQAVIVWARWILIATGLVLSFWSPASLSILQIQLAAIITLAFGNFYLHVQLLRGHPAIDRVVYASSAADLTVVTALVLLQGGYSSPVFVFYFAAVLGLSVAFPAVLTAMYASAVVVVYGVICLTTTGTSDYPAVFTRVLMIAAIAVCGAIFARSEAHRRAEAIRAHQSAPKELDLPSAAGDRMPVHVGGA